MQENCPCNGWKSTSYATDDGAVSSSTRAVWLYVNAQMIGTNIVSASSMDSHAQLHCDCGGMSYDPSDRAGVNPLTLASIEDEDY